MIKKQLKQHQKTCVFKASVNTLGTFCYPTGTGKTLAESHIIIDHIKQGDHGIYVVLVPRIILAQQLFSEIWKEVVVDHKIDCSFFSLHSGKSPNLKQLVKKYSGAEDDQDDNDDIRATRIAMKEIGLTDAQIQETFKSGTSSEELRKAAVAAQDQGRPLIVVSTYHSAERLNLAFESTDDYPGHDISIMIADEGHTAVALGFSEIHKIQAEKRFYFTATLKMTDGGDEGLGMQNAYLFGPMLDALSPKEAVALGLIVGPRIHYVEIADITKENELDADFKSVEAAFVAHAKAVGGIGAKLLVAGRGTEAIEKLLRHGNNFERLRATRPNLTVFDITSAYGARINGNSVSREGFLSRLQGLKDSEEAIIIHYDILSEGIDVPGITGVMPLRALGTSKFLQMLGRATRLHFIDRKRLADESTARVEAAKLDWFVKPHAWLVLPCYGDFGQEIQASAEVYVKNLRTFGWIPGQGDLLTEAGGDTDPIPLDNVHKDGKKAPTFIEMMGDINQRFEDREVYEKVYVIQQEKPIFEMI